MYALLVHAEADIHHADNMTEDTFSACIWRISSNNTLDQPIARSFRFHFRMYIRYIHWCWKYVL